MGPFLLLMLIPLAATAGARAPSLHAAAQLYSDGQLEQAIDMYESLVTDDEHCALAQAGLIRSLLKNDDFEEAHDVGMKAYTGFPTDPVIRTLLGDVFFRMADLQSADAFYLSALSLDPNNARAYWGTGRVHEASFRRKSAQAAFVKAYQLDPEDPDIIWAYAGTLQHDEDRIALLEKYLGTARNQDPRQLRSLRFGIEFARKAATSRKTELRSPYESYKLKLDPMLRFPRAIRCGVALRVSVNDSRPIRLHLDTGASGIIISRKAADRAHVEPVSASELFALGEAVGAETTFGVADNIKIGGLEFANYPVRISAKVMDGVDGLIGTDVFSSFLIKLDIPNSVMELSPLPEYADGNPRWTEHDREVPDDPGAFVPVHRLGHLLLLETVVNDKRLGYFVLDTGAVITLMSEALAREVSALSSQENTQFQLKGLSGNVKGVQMTERVILQFGNIKNDTATVGALDMQPINRLEGFELAGLLGWNVCSRLVISINYREGLISLTNQ